MQIEKIKKGLEKFIFKLQLQQMSCALIPSILIYIFLILKSLLNLSYLFEDSQLSYPYVCAILARPQILIRIGIFDTLTIIVCGIYIACLILPQMRITPYIAIFGEILRTNLFNCFFELCRGQLRLIPQVLLIILYLLDSMVLQGTLNVRISNFQITKSIWLGQLLALMSIVQVISYSYGLNFLKYFTMINSALNLVYYLIYQPYKYQNINLVISSIELITIYLGILRLLEIYSSFTSEIVLIPMIFKIMSVTLKYYIPKANIGDKSEFENQIIFASVLMQKHQYLKAIKLIEKTKSHKLVRNAKRQILYLDCLKQIQILIQTNINSQTRMSEAVKLLMESEKQNTQIQQQLICVINLKIKRYKSFMNQRSNVYPELMQFTIQAERLLKDLQTYYQKYPSEKAQAILGFFYAEIQNDFLAANKLFSVQALLDENSHQKEVISEIFSNKMVYLIAEYNNGLTTKRVSNNIKTLLPYNADQLIGNGLDMLIPKGIANWHDSMINEFFITGKSRYLRSLQSNFFQENGNLISIEFAIDINFIDELQFIAFLQPSANQPIIIILDNLNDIQSVSQSFYEQIDCKKIENSNITLFIKDFNVQIDEFDSIDNLQFTLPKHLSTKSKFQQFSTQIHVQKKYIEGQLIYSVVKFEYFRKYTQKNQGSNISLMTSRMSIQQIEQDHLFEEQVAIMLPYTGIQEEPYLQEYQIQQPQISSRIQTYRFQGEHLHSFYTARVPLQTPIKNSQPSINNNVRNDQHQEWRQYENGGDDGASQVSSLLGVRKSKYFKKYEIISKLADQKEYSKYHLLFNSFFFLALFTQIIIGSVQLVQINQNLTNLVSDIDLLQIKNLIFQPVESFLVTRWTIVNYSILLSLGQLTQKQFLTQVAYPKSYLALGYDAMSINVNQVLNRKELQDILQSVNIQVYLYINTAQGEEFNTTLRGAISILLNYQYAFKMAYVIEGSVNTDSPYFYYSYKNYQVLKDSLSELNEQVLKDTKQRSQSMYQLTLVIFVITISIATLLYLVSLFYFYQITILYQKYIQAIINFNPQIYEEEIIRYQRILSLIEKDQNNLFKYQFNIDSIEKYFDATTQDQEQVKKRQKQHKRKAHILIINWMILLLFIFVIILLNSILTFEETSQFLTKYPATSELYKSLSDVETDVPTAYAQREILYSRVNVPYLTQNDCDKLMNEIIQALARIQIFTQYELTYKNYLISTEFQQYFQQILNSDLCLLIPKSISEKSAPICPLIMSQNMQRGLKSVLVYIFNEINTDKAINQFTKKTLYPYLELEGAFIISLIIDAVNDRFNLDLNSIASKLLRDTNIQNLILLIVLAFFTYASHTVIKSNLANQYSNVQKFLYMTPRRALIQDDVFERNSKALLMLY